jgi:PAS domain S-box-containing protein
MSDDCGSIVAEGNRGTLPSAVDRLAGCAVLTLDQNGTVTSWNTGAERLLGHPPEVAIGQDLSFILPEDPERPVSPHQLLQRAERGDSQSARQPLVHSDGSVRDFSIIISAIRSHPECLGYAVMAQQLSIPGTPDDRRIEDALARLDQTSQRLSESDALLATAIAERKQAEDARLRLLRRLVAAEEDERRRIARDLHDDLGQRLTTLRLALEALGADTHDGTDLSEGLGRALGLLAQIDQGLDFLAWDLRPAALDELGLAKVLENYVQEWSKHTGVRAVFHWGAPEAERFAPEVESSVYRIAQEALNNVAKHAHAQSVNVLLEQRGDAIVLIVEDDGTGLRGHPAGARMNGLTGMKERAAAVGGTLELEPTPEGGTTVLAYIPAAASPAAGPSEVVPAADGAGSASSDAASPTTDDRHNRVVLDAMRGRLHELQHAVAARDEFIATVAHELRNPVAPLMFQVRLALDRSEQIVAAGEHMPNDWVQSQLRRIEQRLHRLLETLDRLLDVSRLSSGRIDLQPEHVNLGDAIREVANTFESELAVARCTLLFADRGDATGWWDRMRLEQIGRNLLSNAIRFGAGRPIRVSVHADQDFATLEVRDHGVGIAPDLHARIFERFERGVERRSGGFGIGLWIVQHICVAMGGTISVDSDVGEGACFTVVLPRHHEREFLGTRSERT